jgi:hypothetical protein
MRDMIEPRWSRRRRIARVMDRVGLALFIVIATVIVSGLGVAVYDIATRPLLASQYEATSPVAGVCYTRRTRAGDWIRTCY